MITLSDNQEVGKQLLLNKKHAALFFEAGVGKTFPAIEAVNKVPNVLGVGKRAIVISTKKAIELMWKKISEYDISHYEFVTFEKFRIDYKTKYSKLEYTVAIIDEAHKCKAHNSQIGKIMKAFTAKIPYVFALTGTPKGNSLIDVYCIFHNHNISPFKDIKYWKFVDEWCYCETKFFGSRNIRVPIDVAPTRKNDFMNIISQYSMTVDLKDECPEIQKPKMIKHYIEGMKTEKYLEVAKGILKLEEDKATTMNSGAVVQKLHQISQGFLYDENKKAIEFMPNKKLEFLKAQNIKKKTCILYYFQYEKELLLNNLPNSTDDFDKFKTDKKINTLVMQYNSVESFNMQFCDTIVYYTYDYSYIAFNQTYHRIYRKGQTKQTNLVFLINKGTVEEAIFGAIVNKERVDKVFREMQKQLTGR